MTPDPLTRQQVLHVRAARIDAAKAEALVLHRQAGQAFWADLAAWMGGSGRRVLAGLPLQPGAARQICSAR